MKVVIPDDYQNAVRQLDCFAKLAGHEAKVYTDTILDEDAEALVLIRERTGITAAATGCRS